MRFLLPAGRRKNAVSMQFRLAPLPAVTLLHLGRASSLALRSIYVMLQNEIAVLFHCQVQLHSYSTSYGHLFRDIYTKIRIITLLKHE